MNRDNPTDSVLLVRNLCIEIAWRPQRGKKADDAGKTNVRSLAGKNRKIKELNKT